MKKCMQWVLAVALIISGLGVLSSCEKFEEANQDILCQWICDSYEETAEEGKSYNRYVEVYTFFENGTGYYEAYALKDDVLLYANYVRGENGNFRYKVDNKIDFQAVAQKNPQVYLNLTIYLLDKSWSPWTVQYADGRIYDSRGGVFTPATEAQRAMTRQWYESIYTSALAEYIIGNWIMADMNGKPLPTNDKGVFTFTSATEAYLSASILAHSEMSDLWGLRTPYAVEIESNKVTLTDVIDEHQTRVIELTVSSFSEDEMQTTMKNTLIVDGQATSSPEMPIRFAKIEDDYSVDIPGTWEGQVTSTQDTYGDGKEHRWDYKADGTFVYYVKDGDDWVPSTNTLNEYFVDGNLLCMRWVDNGVEYREWWEISIADGKMNWTALRQNPDGTTFTATFSMTKVQ